MNKSTKIIVGAGLGVALLLGGVVSFWASSHPDGLEWVAEEEGFLDAATENDTQAQLAPIPDYEAPWVEGDFAKVSLAGVIGTLLTFAVALGIGLLLKRRKRSSAVA